MGDWVETKVARQSLSPSMEVENRSQLIEKGCGANTVQTQRSVREMQGPYGFDLSGSCRSCKFRQNGFFCQLSADELKDFDTIKYVSAHPADAILFMEQQRSQGDLFALRRSSKAIGQF